MVKGATYLLFLAALLLFSCGTRTAETVPLSDTRLLDTIQYYTFRYFWDGAEPVSGMARERFHVDGVYPQHDKHIVTSGGGGFGLMAMVVGMEREFITRDPRCGAAHANRYVPGKL